MFKTTSMLNRISDYKMEILSSSPEAEFIPTDLSSSLIGWYRADDISGIIEDNSSISNWTDKSQYQNNAIQTLSAYQPKFKINSINGLPCIRFDGTNDYLEITSGSFISGSTILIVCSASSATMSGNNGILCGATTSNDFASGDTFIITTGFISSNNPSGWNVGWRGTGITNVTTDFRNWYYWTYRVEPSGSAVIQTSRKNSFEIEKKTTAASSNSSPTKITIGSRITAGIPASPYYNGDIAEIIIYNTDIGLENIELTEQYLRKKYNLNQIYSQ